MVQDQLKHPEMIVKNGHFLFAFSTQLPIVLEELLSSQVDSPLFVDGIHQNRKDHVGLPSNDAEGSRFGQVRFVDAIDGQWQGTRNCLYPNMAGCTMSWEFNQPC